MVVTSDKEANDEEYITTENELSEEENNNDRQESQPEFVGFPSEVQQSEMFDTSVSLFNV